ncbi:MAG: phosphonate metabolism protein/1,5-bisphosphokinase (PRPP-forming) PhnN [Pseudomonadota bacterium]
MTQANEHSRPGTLLLVVGPSGCGKDSLINWLQKRLCDDDTIRFARRTVTRPPSPTHEDHHGVTDAEFERLKADGAFSATWQAHGLQYGLPMECLSAIEAGRVVIANGSRRSIDTIRAAFPSIAIANISIRPDVLEQRLLARGRETAAQVRARLKQPKFQFPSDLLVCDIDNSGALEDAGHQLLRLLSRLAAVRGEEEPA